MDSGTRGEARAFVGREPEIERLRAALQAALNGRSGFLLVVGEPGIGKTRIADALASEARRHGATVLWGRCWEGEGAPAFWPWVRVLRAYARDRDAGALRQEMGAGVASIAQLVAEVRERLPDLPPPPELEPAAARLRLFDDIGSFLVNAAARQPLVVILDDLHWADTPSLLLLQFLAAEIRQARLLLVGTFRDPELPSDHPAKIALGRLVREGERLDLHGFSEDELARFIERVGGSKPAVELVAAVHRLTDGNPFFAGEVVRLLAGAPDSSRALDAIRIPAGVRETISRRLERLSPECRRMLSVAAVIGRQFNLHVLEPVLRSAGAGGSDRQRLLGLLDEAGAAGIVNPVRSSIDRYAFSHALVRETLHEGLSSAERIDLHRRVGEQLLGRTAGAGDADLAELASHFCQAAAGGDADRAVEYAVKAAEQSSRLLAFEDAAAHYEMALKALALREPPAPAGRGDDREIRCQLLLALGDNLIRAGQRPRAKETYLEAANLARSTGQATQLARAALGFAGLGDVSPAFDPRVAALLEEALGALGTETTALRAHAMSRLAEVLYFSRAHERREALSREAVELAEHLGDAATLAYALNARHLALWRPQALSERLAVAQRIVELAERAGNRELVLAGHMWRIIDLLEHGDIAGVDAGIERFSEVASTLRQTFHRWQLVSMQAMRAIMDGRFETGERLVQEAFTLGQQAQSPNAGFRYGVQLFVLRRAQGRFHELENAIVASVDRYPNLPAFQVALALLYSEAGHLEKARERFEQFAVDDFTGIPDDATWMGAMCDLSRVCHALGDARRARILHARLAPYAGRAVVISFAYGCEGAVSRHLGLLAAAMSDWREAVRLFEDGLAMNLRMGARPLAAHTQREYAEMLLARGRADDLEKVRELLSAASATYAELGMSSQLDQARALLARAERWPVGRGREEKERREPAMTAPPLPANVFQKQGDYWTIGYEGTTFRLKHSKGLQYVAHLLGHPGREFHVADLAALAGASPSGGSGREASGCRGAGRGASGSRLPASGAVPDARAKAAYRQRLADLHAELDEAERFNDRHRASRVQSEIEFVTAELSTAYGLYSARRSVDPMEKVRKAVTNQIRRTIARVQREDPSVWRHLTSSVRTGTYCIYRPEKPTRWTL